MRVLLLASALVFGVTAAEAHHSFAMFDHAKIIKKTGTVKELEWLNPHSWLHVAVTENGKTITWSFEAGSIGQMTTSGWQRDSVKAGDKIEIGFHPLKDGSFGGQVLTVLAPDGKTYCQGLAAGCGGGPGGGRALLERQEQPGQ
jgi:hypothetical protein